MKLKEKLDRLGIERLRLPKRTLPFEQQPFSMMAALRRCKERGLPVQTVIDIGASDGRWTRKCLSLFPQAQYLLLEAQEPHQTELKKLQEEWPQCNIKLLQLAIRREQFFSTIQICSAVWHRRSRLKLPI